MWNKFADIVQNKSTKRLALAIVISALLHIYLVGGFDVRLPSKKKEMHTIEARLQMPQAVVKEDLATIPPEPLATLPKLAPKKVTDSIEELSAVTTSQQTGLTLDGPNKSELMPIAESVDLTEAEPQPIDSGLVTNENAYQYVETDFDVRTEVDGETKGTAKIVFNLTDGSQYQLVSLMKAEGLAALIAGDLLQTSEGQLTKNGLQPLSYWHQYGDSLDGSYVAQFDWANKTAHLTTSKGSKIEQITDGMQDLLSHMYQFMYVPPFKHAPIAADNHLKLDEYNFEAEESISIPLGELKTIHISYRAQDTDEKTDLWLALDYQNLPVKIRKAEKNGKVYELVANRIHTARPILN